MNIISSMRRQELCLTGCRLSGIKKRQILFGKKAGTTVALAVLFGLVASAVFLSVSFVAGKYLKTDEKSTHLETTQSVAGTVIDDGSDGRLGQIQSPEMGLWLQ